MSTHAGTVHELHRGTGRGRGAGPRAWWWVAGVLAGIVVLTSVVLLFGGGSDAPEVAPPPQDDDVPADADPGTDTEPDTGADTGADTEADAPEVDPEADDPAAQDPGADEGADEGTIDPGVAGTREPRATWDVVGVAAGDVLNVRRTPGVDGAIVARLAPDTAGIESTGRIATVEGALWRELEIPGVATGWVNARYLTDHVTTPEVTPPPASDPQVSLPRSLIGAEWDRIPTTQHLVALTFDAGANADGVASILATLEATDTAATFFLTGAWTQRYPDLARRIAADFPVGNHSVSHPEFTELSEAQVREEILGAERIIDDVTGADTVPLFRFPFGDRDARTIDLVNAEGYGGFRWTVDTLGWQGTSGGMSADEVVARVVDAATPGEIVLMHVGSHPTDGSTLDADALPRVIERLEASGYRFVTLRDALEIVG